MDWLVPNTFFEKAVFETKFELTVAIYRPCHFNVFRDEITFELAVFELPAFEITPSSQMTVISNLQNDLAYFDLVLKIDCHLSYHICKKIS